MTRKGCLVVVSGFSGVGKGTVMNSLVSRYDGYALSVSATTRQPRPGEEDGREYFFRTEEEFQNMILNDELIEYANYCDHFYGTPRAFVEEQLQQGRDIILEIEIQGARKIRSQYPDAVLIFIMPPSAQELKNRLTRRGTESEQVISERLRRAAREAQGIDQYDYIVINDQADECADRMHALIQSQHSRVACNEAFISRIRDEINQYTKGE